MKERKSVFLLIATMITTCLIVAGLTITILYRTAIEEERARLIETAQNQARLIESTARFNAVYSKNYPGGPIPATLSQVIDAHNHDTAVGKTEIVLSKKEGENIVFLLRHRHKDHSKPEPVPFESRLAEPMRRALSGQSGSVIGPDYHGQMVLAAYEPLKELNLGIVTKMDMSEVRAPFVKAGLIVVFFTGVVVSIGASLFFRVTNPMVRQLEERTLELEKLNIEIEQRIIDRTAEIKAVNEKLKTEIEERKQAQRAVRESEERYALAIAGSTDGIWDWDILSGTVFYSERFRELLGYSPEEFPETVDAFRTHLHPEEADAVWTAVKQHLQERHQYNIKYRLKTKWGGYRWFHARGQAIWDDKGNATRMSGSIQDITDRKRQEAEFQKTRKLLQTVFDGIPDPLILLDENLKVRIINRAAMRYYQIEKAENIIDICCYEALMRKSALCEGCQVPAAVASRKSGSLERKGIINPNKLEQVYIYRFDEEGHNYGGILMRIQDITESRLMERKMIHNEKLASLGLAISCITHEITNPISAITFNAPILKDYINAMISIVDDYAKDREDFELFQMTYPQFREDAFKIIANILHASKRVNATVTDLRKLYGDKKKLKKHWVDLKQSIERIIAVSGVEINQYVKSIETNIPEGLPKIYTDPEAVEHILTNLLTNAAHAADKEDSRVKLDVSEGNTWKEHLIIELSDNGCGIDPETMSKIFNPFFTTKARGQGTGLGLYVCQDLVKDLGGRIEVESEPGRGSVFRVVLPDIERRSVKRV